MNLRFSVRHRVMGTCLVIALMCAVSGVVGYFGLRAHAETYGDLVKREQRRDLLVAANLGAQKMFWLLQDFQNDRMASRAEYLMLEDGVRQKLKALAGFSWQPQNVQKLKHVGAEFDNLRQQSLAVFARSGSRTHSVRVNAQSLAWRRRLILRSLDELRQADMAAHWAQWKAMQEAQARVGWFFIGCLVVVLGAAVVLSHFLARTITRPIEALMQATNPISEGALSTRLPVASSDEFGQLTERFNYMMDTLETSFVETVDALAAALDARSAWTAGHSRRVTNYALDTAQQMRLDRRSMSVLKFAGLLHDAGKVGVPDRILDKPDRLTDEEFADMKKHPAIGHSIMAHVQFLKPMLDGIRHHHERYDGKGYPDGLKGEDIPLLARIIAVADSFDAMTSDRPYRPGMPEEKALHILSDDGGRQWDVEVVDAFMRTRDPQLSRVKQASESLELPVPVTTLSPMGAAPQ